MFKQPITDAGKKSKKGRLSLEIEDGKYVTKEEGTGDPNKVIKSFILLPPEVSSCIAVLEYLRRNTSGSSLNSANRKNTLKYWYSWVVKIRNTPEPVLRSQYTPWPLY